MAPVYVRESSSNQIELEAEGGRAPNTALGATLTITMTIITMTTITLTIITIRTTIVFNMTLTKEHNYNDMGSRIV